ncbi:unnamed protein product, partial [Closterium sp. Yama58-4]
GGAWCASPQSCAGRARTRLGSTEHARTAAEMVDARTGGMNGMLSFNKTVNPAFYNWNAVYFIYCDGGSFSGNQDEPVRFNGIPLYMRGRKVADALVKHLMEKKGLDHAEKVVVTGSSAGGVAALLHCDRVRDTLTAASPSMHVRCLADASMFLDVPDSDNTHRIAAFFSKVQTMHNLTISLPPACVKERALEQHHQCFMANHILQYVTTPLFLINSNYDKVAMRAITQPEVLDSGLTAPPDCFDHLSTCTAKEKKIFEDYRKAVANAVAPLVHSTPANAVFLFSCFQHGSIHSDVPWMKRTAKGMRLPLLVGSVVVAGAARVAGVAEVAVEGAVVEAAGVVEVVGVDVGVEAVGGVAAGPGAVEAAAAAAVVGEEAAAVAVEVGVGVDLARRA